MFTKCDSFPDVKDISSTTAVLTCLCVCVSVCVFFCWSGCVSVIMCLCLHVSGCVSVIMCLHVYVCVFVFPACRPSRCGPVSRPTELQPVQVVRSLQSVLPRRRLLQQLHAVVLLRGHRGDLRRHMVSGLGLWTVRSFHVIRKNQSGDRRCGLTLG